MRIAHISDLHLRHHLHGTSSLATRLSRAMPQRFGEALAQLKTHSPDLLVISGDFIDHPFEAWDDPTTLEQGRKDLELIAALLEGFPCPLAVVHGNHDHPRIFDQVFGHIPNDQIIGGYRVLTFRDDEGENHVPARTGQEQARYLAALSDTSSLPQIHIQHYVVWPERNEGYPHTYGAGAQMREAIINSGKVRLVLSGHYHIGVPLFADSGVWFATARGFTESPPPFCLYDLDGHSVRTQLLTLVS